MVPLPSTLAAAILAMTLLAASVTDLRNRVIPNPLVACAALSGLTLAAAAGRLVPALLAGALAASPFLVAALVKPEGMGMGDVKLAGVMGIYLGQAVWAAIAVGLGVAGLAGVLISLGTRRPPGITALPLAPFLALGAGMVALAGGQVLQ